MKKRIVAILIIAVLVLTICITTAFAEDTGSSRVTIGADLTQEQIDKVYSDFGIERGSVTELTVTNEEERDYLEGLVPEGKIGNVALSCVYVTVGEENSGVSLTMMNINWCTEQMYINALTTAGITDAKVKVTAPKPVSGTAALTGIYKAYEDITGQKLDDTAKDVAAEELVVTGTLADAIGSDNATKIVTELKKILDQTQSMTDDEVRQEIKNIAAEIGVSITDEQVEQLLELCRSLEGLDVDELQSRIESITGVIEGISKVGEFFSDLGNAIKDFFVSVGEFFSNLFGGGN